MTNTIGKNQTFSRKCNIELVLNMIREKPCSASELASVLSLSNATLSSILKELSDVGVICVNEVTSISGLGRKRVNYEINRDYGLILTINISNFHAQTSLVNMQQEIIASNDMTISQYDTSSFYQLILEAEKILRNNNPKNIPLRHIAITLPGRVNSVTGELLLSCQFDKELFSEKHFIQNSFKKQFGDIPISLANDINAFTVGELRNGQLKGIKNAVFINIDYGIGGGLVIDGKPFYGDLGYAGEFGLIKYYNGKDYESIDEFVSIRALCEKASKILNREVKRDELIELYRNNEEIKEMVLETAPIVGQSIGMISNTLDISTFIISGRATLFGEEYLSRIRETTKGLANTPVIKYSELGKNAEILGASIYAIEEIFNQIKSSN